MSYQNFESSYDLDAIVQIADLKSWKEELEKYSAWLDGQPDYHKKRWLIDLSKNISSQREGAIAEAVAWSILFEQVESITRSELIDLSGPDFSCVQSGRSFDIEVTNISKVSATECSALSDNPKQKCSYYSPLTSVIKREVIAKAGQSKSPSRPYVIMVTTLHFQASALCVDPHFIEELLHGRTVMQMQFDTDRGEAVGPLQNVATMDHAAFTKKKSAESARRNVSAVIVAGLGGRPHNTLGALHQEAVRPFDPISLPDIPFARFKTWPPKDGYCDIVWTKGGSIYRPR